MSELAQLTGAASSTDDALPGYALSPWSIAEIGEAEQEFEQAHVRSVAAGTATANPAVQAQMAETAQNCLAWGYFVYGAPGFWAKTATTYLLPFLLWLSLRKAQPQITRAAAATLITPENLAKLQLACRKCAGWKPAPPVPNSQGAAGTPTTDAPPSAPLPSPGATSTASSPAADSPQTPSPA